MNANETLQYLDKGNKSRSTASTYHNQTSSRSHAVFTINLKRKNSKSVNNHQTTNCEKSATVR